MPTIANQNTDYNILIVNKAFRIEGVEFTNNTQLRWTHKSKTCSCPGTKWKYNITAYADGVELPNGIFELPEDFVVESLLETRSQVRPLSLENADAQRYRNNKLSIAPKDTVPTHRDENGYFLVNGNMDFKSGKTVLEHD